MPTPQSPSQPQPQPPPHHHRRRKLMLTLLAIPLATLLLLWVAVCLLLNADWNRARPWLNDKASAALDRPVAIRGDLTLQWEMPAVREHGRRAWRGWIPWPQLLARDVHIGNPAAMARTAVHAVQPGFVAGEMASVQAFSFTLDPLALLDRRIAIPVLRFDAPVVQLLRTADGASNWTFAQHPSSWRLDLQRVIFSEGVVHYSDAQAQARATAQVDTINADPAYGVAWTVNGDWKGAPVTGHGKAGAVLSLQHQTTPYPVMADVSLGGTHIALEGTLTRSGSSAAAPMAGPPLAALDMQLKVSAPSMARLYGLTGIVLPETPPFSTAGHLLASMEHGRNRYVYEHFSGKVGGSDLSGELTYVQQAPRPHLSGAARSHLLKFSDLGPLVGADSNASKRARGLPAVQPANKVLPVESFRTERWTSIDADVSFRADRIVREKQLPIANLYTEFHLRDGTLALTPLQFDWAGGRLHGDVRLAGGGRNSQDARQDAIRAELKATARHIRLRELFPSLDSLHASVGEINGDAALSATGNSVATLLASANGEVKALINQGSVCKLMLEQMGLNLGSVVLAKLMGDRQVRLHCMAADFAVTQGKAQSRLWLAETDDATVRVSGSIDLASEQLDLTLKPDSKGLRIITLRAPIYVQGTFKEPDISIDKRTLALKAGSALALATVAAPLAALLPLINTGPRGDTECAPLLAQVRSPAVAPPPGKQARAHRSGPAG